MNTCKYYLNKLHTLHMQRRCSICNICVPKERIIHTHVRARAHARTHTNAHMHSHTYSYTYMCLSLAYTIIYHIVYAPNIFTKM